MIFRRLEMGGRQRIVSVIIFSHPKTIVHKQKLANCGLNIFEKNSVKSIMSDNVYIEFLLNLVL